MMRSLAALLLSFSLAACGPAARARAVSLRMAGGPPEATVTIDDVIVGRLDVVHARGVALSPGKHRISVEAEGYLPWDRIVEATDAPVRLDITLAKVPD
jgi:hypothetical protein